MWLPYQRIKQRCVEDRLVEPWVEKTVEHGMTYGLSSAGYDCRIDQSVYVRAHGFELASTIEWFNLPNDLTLHPTDKSTWARRGLAVQNTVGEPGWRGHLTLELTNHSDDDIVVLEGMPICQMMFALLSEPTEKPYNGKYQDQRRGPVPAIFEKVD